MEQRVIEAFVILLPMPVVISIGTQGDGAQSSC